MTEKKRYFFVPMTSEYAECIIEWHYDGIYSFYDFEADKEDLEEFINSDNWPDKYFAVLNINDELIGFFSFSFKEDIMWIGLGMKPSETSKGNGQEFVNTGIQFGINHFNYKEKYIMLAVAIFNKRAIKVYEKSSFKIIEKVNQHTNGGEYQFVIMKKDLCSEKLIINFELREDKQITKEDIEFKKHNAIYSIEGDLKIYINNRLYFSEPYIALLDFALSLDKWLNKIELKQHDNFKYEPIDHDEPILFITKLPNNRWRIYSQLNKFDSKENFALETLITAFKAYILALQEDFFIRYGSKIVITSYHQF